MAKESREIDIPFPLIEFKHWFFRYSITFIVVFIVLASITVFYAKPQLDGQLVLAAVGTGLSFIYFIQKQKLEELGLFDKLFKEFNKRYCYLDCKLIEINAKSSEFSSEEKDALIEYFNLCGEEFLYYQLGYIYPEVWKAWLRGMQYYYSNPQIQELWNDELKQESYYGMRPRMLCRKVKQANKRK